MLLRYCLIGLLGCVSFAAHAQDWQRFSMGYVFLSNNGQADWRQNNVNEHHTVVANAGKLLLGYAFRPDWAVQLGYFVTEANREWKTGDVFFNVPLQSTSPTSEILWLHQATVTGVTLNWQPYIGENLSADIRAGGAWVSLSLDDTRQISGESVYTDSRTQRYVFTAGVGLRYRMFYHFSLLAGYDYLPALDFSPNAYTNLKIDLSRFNLGFSFDF